ncbi:MAG: Hydrolase, NUDIX family [Parcubacteria group bacterium GW2011_GWB1_43_6]|nr:MAG: Hydrolase, NUDIX family [Parcubacteria group bacterium GW2011_GWB1_43_6]
MKKKNGITVLSSEVKYSKRGLKVVEENFRHKHGDGEYRYIVLAPQVRVVPLTPEGDFVLINEFKYPQNEFVLGFPAGTVEGGESFLEAAKRELGEETSYTAESFIDFGPYLPLAAAVEQEAHAVLALDVRPGPTVVNPDAYERTSIKAVVWKFNELVDAVHGNKLLDGQALAVLLKAFIYLGVFQISDVSDRLRSAALSKRKVA